MLANKKASRKGEKSVKIVKKIGRENPNKNKQQLKKVKKSVAAELTTRPLSKIKLDEEDLSNATSESEIEQHSEIEEHAETEGHAETEEHAESADLAEIKGYEDGVAQTILVKNLTYETKRTKLVKLFAPCGKIMAILFSSSKSGVRAFIVFDSPNAAEKAMALDNTELDGRPIFVTIPETRIFNETNTVFLSNMGTETDIPSIRTFLEKCGDILKVKVLDAVNNKLRAFVMFKHPKSATEALKLNGILFNNEPIKIVRFASKPLSPKFITLPKEGFKNLDNETFKEEMIKIGHNVLTNKNKSRQNYESRQKKNSEFRGFKAEVIKKTPKKKVNKIASIQ